MLVRSRVAGALMVSFAPRYEFKYQLSAWQIAHVRERAALFMEPDPIGDAGTYDVYSLYFDTWGWQTALEAIEGIRHRFKLRLRSYDPRFEGPIFAEIKRRVGTTILKSRARIPREVALQVCKGDAAGSEDPRFGEFCNHVDRLDMMPRLWVRYRREAWVSAYGCGSRLTFDSMLQAQLPSDDAPLEPQEGAWRDVDLGAPALLELKFNGASPAWMENITQGAGLERVSYSKYTRGAVLLGDLPWAARERDMAWTS